MGERGFLNKATKHANTHASKQTSKHVSTHVSEQDTEHDIFYNTTISSEVFVNEIIRLHAHLFSVL